MKKSLLPLIACLVGLAGCSKPPEVSGLYTKKATLGRHGGNAEMQWDFRSDGTARYQAILDFAEPVATEGSQPISRMIKYAGGDWKLEAGQVTFRGKVTSITDGSGGDLQEDIEAKFKIEPNGDLIGLAGDVPWLPEEQWYSMRYEKQR